MTANVRINTVSGPPGTDWPRHQKTDDQEERVLGVWLHIQRADYRA
ncbi:hypothetical protein [Arthrobacter sp. SLBN-122]|nr:hypothetical protein [Arthrobacter sp. SLBN-122]